MVTLLTLQDSEQLLRHTGWWWEIHHSYLHRWSILPSTAIHLYRLVLHRRLSRRFFCGAHNLRNSPTQFLAGSTIGRERRVLSAGGLVLVKGLIVVTSFLVSETPGRIVTGLIVVTGLLVVTGLHVVTCCLVSDASGQHTPMKLYRIAITIIFLGLRS